MTKNMDNLTTNLRYDYLSTARDQACGIYVTGTGTRFVPPHSSYYNYEQNAPYQWQNGRILADFGLVYIGSGEGIFESAQIQRTIIRPSTLVLLFPEIWHNYHPNRKTGWVEHWVLFNGTYPKSLLQNSIIAPENPLWNLAHDSTMDKCFESLLHTANTRPACYNFIMASYTIELIAKAMSLFAKKENSSKKTEPNIQKALYYIDTNWNKPIDMMELAESLNLSYRNFRQLFKGITGVPPHQYLINMKVNFAKRLLEEQNWQIKDIAHRLGFDDPYYFSRLFKHKMGRSPENWRRSL